MVTNRNYAQTSGKEAGCYVRACKDCSLDDENKKAWSNLVILGCSTACSTECMLEHPDACEGGQLVLAKA